METIITLDERRRTSLAKVGRKEHTRYFAHEREDGSLILSPAVIMPAEMEAAILADPKLRAALEFAKNPDKSKLVDRGPMRDKIEALEARIAAEEATEAGVPEGPASSAKLALATDAKAVRPPKAKPRRG